MNVLGLDMELLSDWAFWTAFFTFVLAIATIALALRTQQLVDDAQTSSALQLRAYLSVKITALHYLEASQTILIRSVVENHGQTPAHHVASYSDIRIREFPLDEHFGCGRPAGAPPSNATIHPREVTPASHALSSAEFTVENFKSMGMQGLRLYVTVALVYQDIFGKDHNTKVCIIMDRDFVRSLGEHDELATDKNYVHAPCNNTAD